MQEACVGVVAGNNRPSVSWLSGAPRDGGVAKDGSAESCPVLTDGTHLLPGLPPIPMHPVRLVVDLGKDLGLQVSVDLPVWAFLHGDSLYASLDALVPSTQ